jgi:DNA-binding MarR family transcriptional regulator
MPAMDPVACLCTNARRAALALTSIYDEALAPHGLKVTQFSLLRAVERHGQPNLTGLAEATGLDRSTLGRNLRVLEGAGIVRLSAGDDQRDRVVTLTAKGRARVRDASVAWKRLEGSLRSSLGEDAERLVAVAHRVTALAGPGRTPRVSA